ncbi:response regulator, partial [bacterium]|nr:response regulator [bacterium]
LVGNAIKFTEEGEVFVEIERQKQINGTVQLHFTISDTGVGIPQEKIHKIFDAFEQVDGSTTREFGGTGLGLAISGQLVKKLGGKIWVESELGKGSTFHFTCVFEIYSRDDEIPTPGFVDLQGTPVLIVDDNETNRTILHEMISNWQMKPVLVNNGRDALHTLHKEKEAGRQIPLAILDVHMPELDGFALAELIKKDSSLQSTTIIMLTSAGHHGDVERCKELNITAYLSKPIKQSDLFDAIITALQCTPFIQREPSAPVKPAVGDSPKKSLHILLAEDNLVNQKLAVRLLEKLGHTVSVAISGKEAVELFNEESFDLIFMDVQMPVMDGLTATQAIREKEKEAATQPVPIVAMTAHTMKGDKEECLEYGMDSYIAKPIKLETLAKAIKEAME